MITMVQWGGGQTTLIPTEYSDFPQEEASLTMRVRVVHNVYVAAFYVTVTLHQYSCSSVWLRHGYGMVTEWLQLVYGMVTEWL